MKQPEAINERVEHAAAWYRSLTTEERVRVRAIAEMKRRFGLPPKLAIEALRQAQEGRYAPD